MKFLQSITLALLSLVVLSACQNAEMEIKWDYSTSKHITDGVYARIKPVGDRFALVYSAGPAAYIRWSSDKCATWSEPQRVAQADGYNYTNCEILELSGGSLLYMWNARPKQDSGLPYKIMIATSDDYGTTWLEQTIYSASTDAREGCWEPVAIELPSGEVQLFFANEYPYASSDEQEITLLRSFDKGKTWSKPEAISMRKGSRDGMPVPIYLPHRKEIAVAIEDNGIRGLFKPVIVRSDNNWADGTVSGNDTRREEALAPEWQLHDTIYAGAPYLIQLGKSHTILSVQSTEGRKGRDHRYANMQVYVGDKDARNFRNRTTPMPQLSDNGSALWNSICAIDSKQIIAVMSVSGAPEGKNGIWSVVGELSEIDSAEN
ncbi:MAG: exo-alpha-sialidase [Alistipes sp.]|nr:exo-alpha-sialidase [Alistipes sp.]